MTDPFPPATPGLIVPLRLSEEDIARAVDALLASGNYTPDDLVTTAVVARPDILYVPAWIFEGRYEASWSASFGYDRTLRDVDVETRTDSDGTHSRTVSRMRTSTEWLPATGTDAGDFSLVGYAGTRLDDKAVALVEAGAAVGQARPWQPGLTAGAAVEPYPVGADATFDRRVKPRLDALIRDNVMAHAQGRQQKGWHWNARIDKTATSVLLPVCRVAYTYHGKTYHIWIDGADASRHAADPLPHDKGRLRSVNFGYLPAGLTIAQLFVAGILSEPAGPFKAVSWSTGGIVVAAWIFSSVRERLILQDSQQRRQTHLADRSGGRPRPAADAAPSGLRWLRSRRVDTVLVLAVTVLACVLLSHAVDAVRAARQTAAVAPMPTAMRPA